MKYTTQSEYGLICLLDLMKMSNGQPVSLTRIAKKEGLSLPYIEKIFSKLGRANIVRSVRGANGGYFLYKDPEQTTLLEIINALEGNTLDVFCSTSVRESIVCTHFSHCGLQKVWGGLKTLIDDYFEAITLATVSEEHTAQEKAALNPLAVETDK